MDRPVNAAWAEPQVAREMTLAEHGAAVADVAQMLAKASEHLVDTQQRHAIDMESALNEYNSARGRYADQIAAFETARNQRNLK